MEHSPWENGKDLKIPAYLLYLSMTFPSAGGSDQFAIEYPMEAGIEYISDDKNKTNTFSSRF